MCRSCENAAWPAKARHIAPLRPDSGTVGARDVNSRWLYCIARMRDHEYTPYTPLTPLTPRPPAVKHTRFFVCFLARFGTKRRGVGWPSATYFQAINQSFLPVGTIMLRPSLYRGLGDAAQEGQWPLSRLLFILLLSGMRTCENALPALPRALPCPRVPPRPSFPRSR